MQLYLLVDPVEVCEFVALHGPSITEDEARTWIVLTGGRFKYLLQPMDSDYNIFHYPRRSVSWVMRERFMERNEKLLHSITFPSQNLRLLGIMAIGRSHLEEALTKHHLPGAVDDLVDQDLLVPKPGDPHFFFPACLYCVYQLWVYERAQDLSLALVRALRYPVGRPHAELLEWYCHNSSIQPAQEYPYLTPPRETNLRGTDCPCHFPVDERRDAGSCRET